ncbi:MULTISPECIES: AraC family transcriptional regulator [Pseudomonas]|uniref:AraC family transcriptional regulator n=1 Tax=Pseudomonas TaxID=286 RepID=UPI000876DC3D|nr:MULTISPECIES: AraC family transcriptional regulator [Pseudomonas]QIA04156.1 AraC family transcriptional regulator [Pseudomonas fluorescens]TFA84812.1 AraC family transcriptional regulator [Pseudomonas sp. LAIL14HWK12:I2]SCZ30735.1 transcriptional regulator, AraC family [Pseudomonas sp. NFIX46]SDB24021.1 transcriptional regulator, AraC family [Pseudomonas putida]SFQ93297.1 transcriptional regulator, AraC family [Pseudomonas sp. NFIX49]
MDRLSTLLSHFGVNAGTFHSGTFCGVSAYGGDQVCGHVHLLQAGELLLKPGNDPEVSLNEPTLIFFPRPMAHRLFANEVMGTQLVCASLTFDGGAGNALAAALPDYLVLKLADLPEMASTLEWLFKEAFDGHCGREAVMDRLFELLVILLLRHLISSRNQQPGMMAGLADPKISRALNLMHEQPAKAWSVAELASAANLSRAGFADHFRRVVGQTPVDYLVNWRISLAQKRLREGRPIALIAEEVGYESPSALARAFRRKTGLSPREWKAGAS